nr:divalent cation tolerance protein CutA [Aeromonas sp.]
LFEPLRQCILAHHPYQVPEILALPASQGHQPYLDWLTQETS